MFPPFGFRPWRTAPLRVPTDRVLPVHLLGDAPDVRGIVMRWMVRFDDVLDAEKLHSALVKLLEMKTWRRLGGRLRLNQQGKLETHVPAVFDPTRPAARFSHVSFDMALAEHPIASQTPRPTNGPSVHAVDDAFRALSASAASGKIPETLDDYLYSDEPPLALQVLTFRDATLLCMNCPHAMMDAVGSAALVSAWCKVLAGREGEVLPLSADDPIQSVSRIKDEGGDEGGDEVGGEEGQAVLKAKHLGGLGMFLFAVRFVLDMLFGPRMETRTIFLPARSVKALQREAAHDLELLQQGQQIDTTGRQGTPFVSEGDVLSAWSTQLIARSLGARSTRTLAAMTVFELQSRLAAFDVRRAAYVQNAFCVATTVLAGDDARGLPLGRLALRLRASLQQQTTPAQVRAALCDLVAALARTGHPPVAAEPDSLPVPISNLTKARFFDVVDLGPAVVGGGGGGGGDMGRSVPPGKPVFLQGYSSSARRNPLLRNVVQILGKDLEGNYWITGILSPGTWAEVHEELEGL
ncbi:hypothetical protein B0T26DRAFT_677958 [Lasiosphaeria miniovina]|uniref:Uncharacterized protein n=1 Tax=Lasiosphaeria miniovina TaxID=1954250 RepID=A0AA40AD24_9PEZI|nr:uncharacterized protein B0T26DRAFT_677958 [Lasiosphaeria miniovina]KAK0713652.1 hypothetical protein B0T26DRAFT_677958 [Lasiosphaeria miniovina]